MSEEIKVSVIVPVYNVKKYLAKCLDSIIAQTLKDIEIICVNDGSTDGSDKVLEEYKKKDARIQVVNRKTAGGGVIKTEGRVENQGKDDQSIGESKQGWMWLTIMSMGGRHP